MLLLGILEGWCAHHTNVTEAVMVSQLWTFVILETYSQRTYNAPVQSVPGRFVQGIISIHEANSLKEVTQGDSCGHST